MPELETPEEFRARMRSIGLIKGGRTRPRETVITRPGDGGVDAGRKAKRTVDEQGSVITESDNRQDVNIVPPTHYQTLNFGFGQQEG